MDIHSNKTRSRREPKGQRRNKASNYSVVFLFYLFIYLFFNITQPVTFAGQRFETPRRFRLLGRRDQTEFSLIIST